MSCLKSVHLLLLLGGLGVGLPPGNCVPTLYSERKSRMPSLLGSLHALGLTAHSRADWAPIKQVSSAHCVP
jgi:hypothetical protein